MNVWLKMKFKVGDYVRIKYNCGSIYKKGMKGKIIEKKICDQKCPYCGFRYKLILIGIPNSTLSCWYYYSGCVLEKIYDKKQMEKVELMLIENEI